MTGPNPAPASPNRTRPWLLRVAACGLLLAGMQAHAQVEFDIPAGLVEVADDGQCSLVEAFLNINSGSQVFISPGECPAGEAGEVHNLNLTAGPPHYVVEDTLTVGSSSITIFGNGAIILRDEVQDDFRLFDSFCPFDSIEFSLFDLTLDGVGMEPALISHCSGVLSLNGVTLTDSSVGIDAIQEVEISVVIENGSVFQALDTGIIFSGQEGDNFAYPITIHDARFTEIGIVGVTLSPGDLDMQRVVFEDPAMLIDVDAIRLEDGFFGVGSSAEIADTLFDGLTGVGINIFANSVADVRRSTFIGGSGTGIRLNANTSAADIRNSTFSGLDLGLDARASSQAMINNATFAFNAVAVDREDNGSPQVFASNSIFANSSSENCNQQMLDSEGYNLDDDGSCITVNDFTSVLNEDPLLGALADNGGFTPTHALMPGSPAIDAGSPFADEEFGPVCESTDQRGVARPQGQLCDIGAFELAPTNPEITLDKSITSGSPFDSAGDVIVYELVATNTGDVTLTNVTISDPDVDVTNCTPVQGSSLDPAESMSCDGSYTVTQDDVDGGGFVNTATAEGTAPDDSIVSDMDTAIADGLRNPDIALDKSITSGDPYAEAGDIITYLLVATNTGNITLGDVTISDPDLGALDCTPTQPAELAPGETLSCTGSYTVTTLDVAAESFTNTATASGEGTDETFVDDTDSATATAGMNPEITLAKTITSGSPYVNPGNTITYSLVATNTGNITLTGVTISDPALGALSCVPAQPAVREPGTSLNCTGTHSVTQANIDAGSFTNTATALGTAPDSSVVSDTASATAIASQSPAITLDKSIVSGSPYANPGDVISYSLVATNSGNVTLGEVSITDSGLDSLVCDTDDASSLSDTPKPERARVHRLADSQMRVQVAGGTRPLQIVLPPVLATGESTSCTGSYTVGQEDIDAGSFTNTALASARTPLGVLVLAEGAATAIGPPSAPAITLEKTVTAGSPYREPGDVIEYLLVATNTGNVTLRGVAINDPLLDDLDCAGDGLLSVSLPASEDAVNTPAPAGRGGMRMQRLAVMQSGDGAQMPLQEPDGAVLAPAAELRCTGAYMVSPGDLDAGSFTNTAEAIGVTPDASLISASASAVALGPLRLLPEETDLGATPAGDLFEALFLAVGGAPPYVFSVSGVPDGIALVIAGNELFLSGTPVRAGRHAIAVTLRDSQDPPDVIERSYQLLVSAELEILPAELPAAVQGTPYHLAFTVANGVAPYVFDTGETPPGLTLVGNALSGTPTESGIYTVIVDAVDAQGNTGSRVYDLLVQPPGLALEQDLPDAVIELTYGHQLFADGGVSPLSWTSGPGLPAGVILQSTGFLSGVPMQTGEFTFNVSVTDVSGATASAALDLTVVGPRVVNATPPLPPGLPGRDYSAPLVILGENPPFDCSVPAGFLPAGTALSSCGEGIRGTPGVAGTFSFDIEAVDSAVPPTMDRRGFSIRIADPAGLALGQEPELAGAVTVNVPVPEFGRGRPAPDLADESLQQMAIDPYGNRLLAGFAFNGEDYDVLILNFGPDGTPVWSQVFDSGGRDQAYGIAVNPVDQGFYVAGFVLNANRFEGLLLSYDPVGVLRWEQRVTGGVLLDALYGVAADENAVYVVGERYNGRTFDGLIAAFDHAGNPLWEHLRTTADTQTGYVISAPACPAAPCPLIAGGSENPGLAAGWLLELDRATGNVSLERRFAEAGITALADIPDGFIIGGNNPAGGWRVVRLDTALQPQWSTLLANGERLRGVSADEAGFVYAAGRTSDGADALIELLSPAGQSLQSFRFNDGARERFNAVGIGPEGLVSAAGERTDEAGNRILLLNLDTGKAF